MPDREDGDDRVAASGQVHIVDPLPAAPGDPVVIGRGSDAVALFRHAQHEFFTLREIDIHLLGNRVLIAAVFVIRIVGFERRFRGCLALLPHLPPPPRGEAQISVAHIGGDLLVAQDRHRDHLVVAK